MTIDSPYKGLDAFGDSDQDALLFFGRGREREVVVANLIASRLTVLYGPTGVGKSSLLRAGVARTLRALPESPVVVVFDRWSDDPLAGLAEAIAGEAGEEEVGDLLEQAEQAQRVRDVYLILDQAEEYFVYHDREAAFESQLARLVTDPLRVNALVSLREDSLARLDRFKARIPFVYANSLRLDRLDREDGRAAIMGPVERWNELTEEDVTVEPELVDAVLDGVRAGRIEQGVGGLGAIEGDGRPATVEAPYLQLVMQRLWDVERHAGSDVLRAETLVGLGGARQVVRDHLDRAVGSLTPEQREVAGRLFTYLVTPSGTKIAHELTDLSEYAGVSEAEAAPVVAALSRHRILRPDEAGRTEIFHDVLAGEVLSWRRRHAAERALEREREQSRRRHRRLAWLAAGSLLGFVLMSLLTVFALSQRSEAREQAQEAKARELDASAIAVLPSDPELSVLLAQLAAELSPTGQAEDVLREALLASRVRTVVDAGGPLLGATVVGSKLHAVGRDGSLVVADAVTGHIESRQPLVEGARAAEFGRDGLALVVDRAGDVWLVRPEDAPRRIPGVSGARRAIPSHDGRTAALLDGSETIRLVDSDSGRLLQELTQQSTVTSAAFSEEGQLLVTGGDDSHVRLFRTETGKRPRVLNARTGRVASVAFSPRGTLVAGGTTDAAGPVWHARTGALEGVLVGHGSAVVDVAFSSDGRQLVTASTDGTARTWRDERGIPLLTLAGHSDSVTNAAFVGGERLVVTASEDGTARIWDVSVQPELRLLARLSAPVEWARFTGGSRRIQALAGDGSAHVLRFPGGAEIVTRKALEEADLVTGPDGTTARVRGRDVVLVGGGAGRRLLEGHRDAVTSVAFSPDGSLLVTASRDRDARLWETFTGKPVRVLRGHFGPVSDARFSPDGRWIVTAGPGKAGLWRATSGRLVLLLRGHKGPITSASFDPSGSRIVTSGVDGTVRTYFCEICSGIDQLVALAHRQLRATGRELTPGERARYLG